VVVSVHQANGEVWSLALVVVSVHQANGERAGRLGGVLVEVAGAAHVELAPCASCHH